MSKRRSLSHTTHTQARAIVLARQLPDDREADIRASLAELARLLERLGIQVTQSLIQRRTRAQMSTVIGSGKQEELVALVKQLEDEHPEDPLLLVFDGELSPGQQRFLQEAANIEVTDRTGIILRIFEQRAQTRLAKLEVELASLTYSLPRVREDGSLRHQGGGGGRGERGHGSVELRKFNIRERVVEVRRELEALGKQHTERRTRREGAFHVALVGYTNAGKSSWMRALTGSDVLVQNALFATLGTTVRALSPAVSPRVLVSDTVGFIGNLPHELVASFLATLDEARHADLLLIVADAADPAWREQLRVTREALQTIEASDIPALVVLNKVDLVEPEQREELGQELPEALLLSAHASEDIARLRQIIVERLFQELQSVTLEVPFDKGHLRGAIHEAAEVLEESYTEQGAVMRIRAFPEVIQRWQHQLGISQVEAEPASP